MAEIEKVYFSLRETEAETGVPATTLRFWEKAFDELSPRKDGHGNRYYTREDQELIKRIKYIRDELKITRIEAIRKELRANDKHSDERQSAIDILLRVKEELCEIAPYLVALVVFIGFAVLYCSPILEGKVLQAGDVNNWKGAAQESLEYNKQHDDCTWWTNSMFGGMPTYQIAGRMKSGYIISWWRRVIQNPLGEPRAAILLYFIGFFLMLLCFGVNPWLSLLGALAIGMSSYFFLIIPAGHMSKAFALGALAPLIGGVYAVFRKKYWLGIPVILIFAPYGILLHPQMTYYIGMLLGVMVMAEIVIACQAKDWKGLGISLAIMIACVGLIYGTRYTSLKMNSSYLKETMRGGHSELTKQAQDKPAEGLDIKYATDWSYGKGETMTLLIPNWEGGAAMPSSSARVRRPIMERKHLPAAPYMLERLYVSFSYSVFLSYRGRTNGHCFSPRLCLSSSLGERI